MRIFQAVVAFPTMMLRLVAGLARTRMPAAMRAPEAYFVPLRFQSTDAGAEASSAQEKLDQLADFLESQPQERPRPRANRAQRDTQRRTSGNESRGPTKFFQNGHVRVTRCTLAYTVL